MAISDFICVMCGKARTEVRKLISGPWVFICDACVAACLEAADGAAGQTISLRLAGPDTPEAITRFRQEAPPFRSEWRETCSFCGTARTQVRLFFEGYLHSICSQCLGLCLDILVEEYPDEWKERNRSWPEARHGS